MNGQSTATSLQFRYLQIMAHFNRLQYVWRLASVNVSFISYGSFLANEAYVLSIIFAQSPK